MGCLGCSVVTDDGKPGGCRSNGGCSSGGCNRLNTFDWLTSLDIEDSDIYNVIEVTFKNGAHKDFFRLQDFNRSSTGDMVVVETGNGYDVGKVSLSGDLVRLQMKKKKISDESVMHTVIRRANERDMEKLQEARKQERPTMIRARAIARTLGLEMKIGDVEFQGDKRKATFYYTADGRVDFRELIRHFAKEFRVKIEMRQIGARQESARIGGMGSCGRELCCSTWLTDFKSVSTSAARYQNLAINQAKLSGQCGRLKCCLNYELDTYLDALEQFPPNVDKLDTKRGGAILVKTDIFKGLMFYAYEKENGRGKVYPLDLDRVKEVKAMNKNGEKPDDLVDLQTLIAEAEEIDLDYKAVNDIIELPIEEKKGRRRKKKNRRNTGKPRTGNQNIRGNNSGAAKKSKGPQEKQQQSNQPKKQQNKNRKPNPGNKNPRNRNNNNNNNKGKS